MGWTTEKSGFDSLKSQKVFLLSTASRPPLDPPSIIIYTGGCFPGVKRQGREASLSSPFSTEVKNGEAITLFFICHHGVIVN
jgi:hypothetical protein